MAYGPGSWSSGPSGGGGSYSPTGSWGDGSGGGSWKGASGGWGGGGGRTGTAAKPRKSQPQRDLANSLVRLALTLPKLDSHQRDAVESAILAKSKGLETKEY